MIPFAAPKCIRLPPADAEIADAVLPLLRRVQPGDGNGGRRLLAIGIGAGDPEYLTLQAINALNSVDVFFVLDKGPATGELTQARRRICQRYARQTHRIVEVPDAPRTRDDRDYATSVDEWRERRARILETVIAAELPEGSCGGLLVWGDPSLYDGSIAVIHNMLARGSLALDFQVIPGISSVQSLAARHRITVTQTGGQVHLAPGRKLAARLADQGNPIELADDIVVMLDTDLSCARVLHERLLVDHSPASSGRWTIYWGAYLGTPDECLIAGPLPLVLDHIISTRRSLRTQHGWIMDLYLLRNEGKET